MQNKHAELKAIGQCNGHNNGHTESIGNIAIWQTQWAYRIDGSATWLMFDTILGYDRYTNTWAQPMILGGLPQILDGQI